jgi:hypothetical protein
MRENRKFISLLVFLLCFSCLKAETAGYAGQAQMLQPKDLFRNFPEIRWGMSFHEAKKVIEKTGRHPVGLRDTETELVWDGTFNEMNGRSTVLFKEGKGAYEIAVIVYAMEKRQAVFEQWTKKITDKHGVAKAVEDNSIATSRVWKLPNGFAIELRLLKDDNSPVVDLHWVKQ